MIFCHDIQNCSRFLVVVAGPPWKNFLAGLLWYALSAVGAATFQPTAYMDSICVMLNGVKHLYGKDPSLSLRMTKKRGGTYSMITASGDTLHDKGTREGLQKTVLQSFLRIMLMTIFVVFAS